jgi:hypothetical protein
MNPVLLESLQRRADLVQHGPDFLADQTDDRDIADDAHATQTFQPLLQALQYGVVQRIRTRIQGHRDIAFRRRYKINR